MNFYVNTSIDAKSQLMGTGLSLTVEAYVSASPFGGGAAPIVIVRVSTFFRKSDQPLFVWNPC